MMLGQERQAALSAEFIIRAATVALAIVSGIGAAFGLWNVLHTSPAVAAVDGAVLALALGLGLISLAMPGRTIRLFLVLLALSMAIAFFAGSGAFATITA